MGGITDSSDGDYIPPGPSHRVLAIGSFWGISIKCLEPRHVPQGNLTHPCRAESWGCCRVSSWSFYTPAASGALRPQWFQMEMLSVVEGLLWGQLQTFECWFEWFSEGLLLPVFEEGNHPLFSPPPPGINPVWGYGWHCVTLPLFPVPSPIYSKSLMILKQNYKMWELEFTLEIV